jgi:mannose PTS system EIIA component
MLGMLVVTHGRLAEDLVAATQTIVGPVPTLAAVSIDWNDDPSETLARIREARETVDQGHGVLLLTDMFGGTPTNLALQLLEPGRLEIVTGVNLPMLIKFANLRQKQTLREVALALAQQGRESIQVASEILAAEAGCDGPEGS